MKLGTIKLIAALSVVSSLGWLCWSAAPAAEVAPTSLNTSSADSCTQAVKQFYAALIQGDQITIQQEQTLLSDGGLRRILITQNAGKDSDPVLLAYARGHKDLFLPKNFKALNGVQVTSGFNFISSLARDKETPAMGTGYVIALFPDDATAKIVHPRTVVFHVANGKIDFDAICFGGFEGKMMSEIIK